MENWKELTKQIKNNVNGGWTEEDIICEYIENSGNLPDEIEGINKFLASMERKYQDEFINYDIRSLVNSTWNHQMSNIYSMVFREVIKTAIKDYMAEFE
jgi:hypothetical protein